MANFTLGLDLGTNSIGWAAIEDDDNQMPSSLTACGARIFQEAVNVKTRIPKNQTRRGARGARKLVARRKMRRDKVLNLLLGKKFIPEDAAERERLFADCKLYDPYELRKKALDGKLDLYELGRALYHLSQRRGFKSNFKKKSDDDGEVKSAISSLRQEMLGSKSRTLGEYLTGQTKKRCRYTDRAMYQEEFELIWLEQQKHHPDHLDTSFKVAVHNAIFFQRPPRRQKNLIGSCTFEPSRKRASRALLETQRFRMLQDVNNLTIKNPKTREFRRLADGERAKLMGLLEKQKTLGWNNARKKLGLHEGEVFNLEEGKKKELIGNRTDYALRSILGERWDGMKEEQDALITDRLTIDSEQGFLNRMTSHWEFDPETAEKLAKTELEPGNARLSRKAICRILPYLEKGMIYNEACAAAGYDHSRPNTQGDEDKLGEPPYLRNPVVQKALYETRKLINAIVRQYGKPSRIRVEMARDMKLTKKQREETQKRQKAQENTNKKVQEVLRSEFGIQNPSRADIQKYNMWQECKTICPYTGKEISREMLFSAEVDVEHILPYDRSLDDSYMNKTLCIAEENRAVKKNRTPYEAYHADEARYAEMLLRVKALPFPKRKKFEQKELDTDKFVERQLNDTRYICVEVKKYLERLGVKVEITKGEATGALRHRWNLNKILDHKGLGGKNREDHRHHAVDAIVIALTSRRLFKTLSSLSAQSGASLSERGFRLDEPYPSFYADVAEKIRDIIVSHCPARKITGALHEETAYGYDEHADCFVYRKPLQSLTLNETEKIRDAKVRELTMARLKEHGNDVKKAFGDDNRPLMHVDGKTQIKSVRLAVNLKPVTVHGVKNRNGKDYKFFKYGNNHHVEIIEDIKTGKRKGIFVTALEAAKRARIDKIAIFQRDHGHEYRFVMSLCINDMVEFETDDQKKYYRVQILDGSNKKIIFRFHTAATLDDNAERLITSANTLRCTKVTIDALGKVMPRND